jgi:hypothetical protein
MQKEKSRGGTASPHIRARGSHVASRSCHPECEIRTRNGRQEPYDRCNCACTSFSAQQSGSCPRSSHKGSHAYIFSSNFGSRGVSQAGIQGFYDPAPASPKLLCVRYLFRDRQHYAEIPDYVPVVLPLPGVSIVLIQAYLGLTMLFRPRSSRELSGYLVLQTYCRSHSVSYPLIPISNVSVDNYWCLRFEI